jgi:co-chaperonin GroES (HSP10)
MSNVVPLVQPEEFPIEAIDDIVIIEQLTEEKSAGGILLQGDARKFPSGRVVAVGPGKTYAFYMDAAGNTLAGKTVPTNLQVGDWVLFGKFNSGGEPIELNGKRYLMCRQGDIAGRSRTGEALRVRLSPE